MKTTNEHRIEVMDELGNKTIDILKNDYVKTVSKLSGTELTCMQVSTWLSMGCAILTGISSVFAFSAGYWHNDYLSFTAGCTGVIAMILMKGSYYANSQSHYYDAKLKNHLTKDYQFIHSFVNDPLAMRPVSEPPIPDPMGIMDGSELSRRISAINHVESPPLRCIGRSYPLTDNKIRTRNRSRSLDLSHDKHSIDPSQEFDPYRLNLIKDVKTSNGEPKKDDEISKQKIQKKEDDPLVITRLPDIDEKSK